jgi:8-oxo-dGTP pyrophosphatase MutT (NUDIX family)
MTAHDQSDPAEDSNPGSRPGGVVAVFRREDQFLLIQRGLELPRAPGMFCFPGGTVEPGESALAALHREMREELGVPIEPLQRIWNCRTERGVQLEWWATELPAGVSIRPCPIEIAWHGWLPLRSILALNQLLPTNHEFLERFRDGQICWPGPSRQAPPRKVW